jgi:tRNA-2-methylthio-N6-dimethylallyladenosine synthase
MPVQSGSDRLLKRMIRRYTRAEYIERVRRLQGARPGITLSTDVIVGFPGETEEDFDATLSLVRELGFVSLFGFKFSPRPHTPALKLADDVPEVTKAERLARLFEVSEGQLRAHLQTLAGTTQRVLVEGRSERNEEAPRFEGRTERNEIVHIEEAAAFDLVGREVEVRISRANKHSLAGLLTESAKAALPAAPRTAVPRTRALPIVL